MNDNNPVLLEDDDPRAFTGVEADLLDLQTDAEPLLTDDQDEDSPLGSIGPLGASWFVAPCLEKLRAEVDARWPKRSKTSDGSVGDTSHNRRKSDHNPDHVGCVKARDFDKDGIDAPALAEHIRDIGAGGFDALEGGYVIWNRRIAGTHTSWRWHAYDGANPHTSHIHVSCADARSNYRSTREWGIAGIGKKPAPKRDRWLGLTNPPMTGEDVKGVQRALKKAGAMVLVDGEYGPGTANAVGVFQRNRNIKERGVGPKTWAALRVVAHAK